MKNYEGLFIIKPDLREEDAKNACKAISELMVKNGAAIKKEEEWGKRQLAYKVKKFKEGYYYKVEFAAPAEAILKMEGAYKLSADILRTMITVK